VTSRFPPRDSSAAGGRNSVPGPERAIIADHHGNPGAGAHRRTTLNLRSAEFAHDREGFYYREDFSLA
jgi:hypothetical protein